ncbi:hypothetical protein PW52_06350 [Tamlana sedimentorum]|uniref:Uncharacterized protein n=1 Tax=Neotamlana sedimentorum TaxID=1435349 RepID=A0A0D7WAL4_9FLAO|nr:hypothetical protein [Tamlana sedimentorum]KJD36215.1 hypothetical protein PW52_06350 [Tamlana sedimentorum]
MKTKIITVFLILILPIFTLFSQDSTKVKQTPPLKTQIEEIIDDNYIRIPKKDFDTILENRLSNLVNSKINTLIGITAGLITLLSLFSIFQFNKSKVSNEKLIQAEVNIAAKESIVEIQKFYKENIESKLSEIEKRFEQNIELLKKENKSSLNQIHEQIEKAKTQVKRAEDYITNLEIESLTKLIVNDNKYEVPEDLIRTQNLLNDVESTNNTFQIPSVVNLLSYIYYGQKQYNEVNELISKYEKEFKLKSTTYINGALTAFNDYHNYNSINQRFKCMEYLDKSLELTQGYGQALALKLEVLMMDILRTEDELKKQDIKASAQKVIKGILNSENKAPAYETFSRLERDAKNLNFKKYVSQLFIELPNDMDLIFIKANEAADILKTKYFILNDFIN